MRALAKCTLSWGMGTVLVAACVLSGADARVPPRQSDALDWQTFTIPSFGTKVEYPAGIFEVSDGKSEQGVGERLRSADGRAVLTIYSRENDASETPARYLRNNLRLARSALDYERVAPTFFAISLSAPRRDLLQPLQFLLGDGRRGALLRPGLSAARAARLGRDRDPHQPLAAAARASKNVKGHTDCSAWPRLLARWPRLLNLVSGRTACAMLALGHAGTRTGAEKDRPRCASHPPHRLRPCLNSLPPKRAPADHSCQTRR